MGLRIIKADREVKQGEKRRGVFRTEQEAGKVGEHRVRGLNVREKTYRRQICWSMGRNQQKIEVDKRERKNSS